MNPLFYSSYILFSDENIKRLKNSCVSLAGIGGVGATALEMLVRSGIQNFKIADSDIYSEINLNRQIFATKETIGKNKAIVAKERMHSINPECNIKAYTEGVTLENIYDFCDNTDIIMALLDTETIKVLLHKIAKEKHLPIIFGSRESLENSSRWCVSAKLWDYKNNPNLKTFGETNHPEIEKYPFSELNNQILTDYELKIRRKKLEVFSTWAENEIENNNFKTISNKELYEKITNTPDAYNRHVCSVIANTAGCLAATSAIRYVLNSPVENIKIDLWQE